MRFLLNQSKSALNRATKVEKNGVVVSSAATHHQPSLNTTPNGYDSSTRIFGQQCSPQCGCAVRFEATFETGGSNRITSMTYDAKTVVTRNVVSSVDGSVSLEPVYTTSQHKPLMKECKCKTIHSLASTITQTLPQMTLSQAQNQLEFKGVRASPSFRYSVLKNNNLLKENNSWKGNKNCFEKNILNVNGGHCFDLVEEALVACLNGYVPQPRNTVYRKKFDVQFEKPNQLMNEFDRDIDNSETGLDPLRFVNAAKKRTAKLLKLSTSFPNLRRSPNVSDNMPQFHLMEMDDPASDTLRELRSELEYSKRKEKNSQEMMDDWLSYLDEMEESEGN